MADRDVSVRLSAQVGQYVAGMQAASAATDRVTASGANLAKLGGQLSSIGRTMTMGVTAPMVAAGAAAVTMSNRFNTSFTRMTTLAGMSTREIGGMRDAVLSLSKQTGRGPQELADALYNASSSGLDARQSLDAVTIAAKGAAAGLGSSGDIISLVASATNSYGAEVMDAAKATDILVGTIREGRADPDELAGSLGRILPVAASLGVSFEEVGGSVAFLSNIMGDTNMTITSLGDLMTKLQSPTQQGRAALEQYGSSMEQLHRIISEDGLLGAMQHLRDIGLSDDPLAFRAVFEDVQAQRGARAMIDNLGNLETAIDGVKNSSGALKEAWNAAQGEEGFQMAQSWAEIQVALVEFGDAIGPVAADIAGGVAQIASAFASLPDGVQMAIAGVLIAVGPLAMVAGAVVKNVGIIQAALAKLPGGALILPVAAVAAYAAGDSAAAQGRRSNLEAEMAGNGTPQSERSFFGLPVGDWMTGDVSGSFNPSAPRSPASWFLPGQAWSAPTPPPGARMAEAFGDPVSWIPSAPSGPPTFGPPPGVVDRGIADLHRYREAVREVEAAMATMDWGAAAWSGAQRGLSAFNTQLFGSVSVAASMEGSMDSLSEALKKVGTIGAGGLDDLNLKTEEGRAAMGALQQVAAAWQPALEQAVVAADGNVADLGAAMSTMRADFIEMAVGAGIGRTEAEALATAVGLIPENAPILIELSGQEEARTQLGMLSGVIGNLREEAQAEMVMHMNNGDFIAALEVVMRELGLVPDSKNTALTATDGVTAVALAAQRAIDAVRGKNVYINVLTNASSASAATQAYVRNVSAGGKIVQVRQAEGGYWDRPTNALIGEAGAEVVLPLTRPARLRELLSDARVMAPIAAAMGGMAAGTTGSSTAGAGATVRTQLVVQGSIFGVDHLNRVLDQRDRELARRLAVAR